ncbi:MAG: phenylalanine--tRNA ligase subunit alpha [bacterium]|nr:phenylalanine--tRNA ligase subunit alpha [bacterium]
MKAQLEQLKGKIKEIVEKTVNIEELKNIEVKFLGRKGELTNILKQLKNLPDDQKPVIGKLANEIKNDVINSIKDKIAELSQVDKITSTPLDMTWPGEPAEIGHLHPITQFQRKIEDIFLSMGFEILDGPEIETPKYNFDLLNIPKDHPARDMWDTFYLEKGLVLRTHTSPMQLRAMETRKPPVRLLVPGRTFRHEATDASHETIFHQYEGLVIDQCISVRNLLGTLESFFQALFGKDVKIKANGSYFPFTEPSLEISMSCLICQGAGCSVCQKTGWLEMLGAGMVHPKVLKNMNVDPEKYSGFAFGGGIERLMMLYHGIDDIRLSYKGDLNYLEQF